MGAEFKIVLPLAAQGEKPRSQTGSTMKLDPALPLYGKHVLLVDDDFDALDLYQRLLAEAGARATAASSTEEALSAYALERPDVIVCDIGMPFMDGYEFVRRLRRKEMDADGQLTPVVAVTAYARAEDRSKALAEGFSQYLAKPLDADKLLNTLGLALAA